MPSNRKFSSFSELKEATFRERVDREREKMSGTWGTATIGKPVHHRPSAHARPVGRKVK